ncbi:hypothetical protein BOX15_Mlig013427g1, partial [Macrostomum lignano]
SMRRSGAPSQSAYQSWHQAKRPCLAQQQQQQQPKQPASSVCLRESSNSQEQQPGSGDAKPAAEGRQFACVWGKNSAKKHKVWEGDGLLRVLGARTAILLDAATGAVLGRGCDLKPAELAELDEGSRLSLGGRLVEICGPAGPIEAPPQPSASSQSNSDQPVAAQQPQSLDGQNLSGSEQAAATAAAVAYRARAAFKPVALSTAEAVPPPRVPAGLAAGVDPDAFVLPPPPPTLLWDRDRGADTRDVEAGDDGGELYDVVVDRRLTARLRRHQRDGVAFLYSCVLGSQVPGSYGAILADAMGLGKTLQSISLVWTLLHSSPYSATKPLVRRALIVTPGSLVANWRLEFYKWLPWARSLLDSRMLYCVGHEGARPEDYRGQAVLLISYEMLLRWAARLSEHSFDLLICDEGHRLKNAATQTAQALAAVGAKRRIVLTGTPVQNDLDELYTLVDFVSPGRLGDWPQFRAAFVERIAAAADSAATEDQLDKGRAAAEKLSRLIAPMVLRRCHEDIDSAGSLPPKRELVIFCRPSDLQRRLFDVVCGCAAAVEVLSDKLGHTARLADGEHLRLIGLLRKVASDPALLHAHLVAKQQAAGGRGGNSENYDDLSRQLMSEFPLDFDADGGLNELIDDNLVATSSSGKLSVTSQLLQRICRGRGRNCVLASNSTKTLDLLGRLCAALGLASLRLDGATPTATRQRLVDQFNDTRCIGVGGGRVLLLSTKAGGVGLNLTGASDLILFDIDWNPANDAQATARIWREGQRRPCSVYRLLTAGSIEERIFLRQVKKLGLSRSILDSASGAASALISGANGSKKSSTPRFTRQELAELFTFVGDTDCLAHDCLNCRCLGSGSGGGDDGHSVAPPQQPPPAAVVRRCQLGYNFADSETASTLLESTTDRRQRGGGGGGPVGSGGLALLSDWHHVSAAAAAASGSDFAGFGGFEQTLMAAGDSVSFVMWHEVGGWEAASD